MPIGVVVKSGTFIVYSVGLSVRGHTLRLATQGLPIAGTLQVSVVAFNINSTSLARLVPSATLHSAPSARSQVGGVVDTWVLLSL